MSVPNTETLYCPVCEDDTPHAEKWRRDKSRSHEAPRPARLVSVCMGCGETTELLGRREGER